MVYRETYVYYRASPALSTIAIIDRATPHPERQTVVQRAKEPWGLEWP